MGFPEMEREKTSQPIQPEQGKEVPAVSVHVTSSLATGENWGMMGKTTSDDNGISRREQLSTRSWQDTVRSPRQTGCQELQARLSSFHLPVQRSAVSNTVYALQTVYNVLRVLCTHIYVHKSHLK